MDVPIARLTRRERKRDATRSRLYEAAVAEFRDAGFDRSSVARIARKAGVSRASFYFHFPSKEHVLLELQWGIQQELAARVAACDSLRAALHTLVEGLIEAESSVQDAELHRDMMMIYARRPEWLSLDDIPSPLRDELERQFAVGAAAGELRAGLAPEQAADLCLTSLFGFLIGSAEPAAARRADLQALVDLYLDEGGS